MPIEAPAAAPSLYNLVIIYIWHPLRPVAASWAPEQPDASILISNHRQGQESTYAKSESENQAGITN
jgi:hypothetical protein